MDPLTAGAITGGAGVLGTYLSNQESAKQAQQQMDFQERMSNTAHQREVSDLRAAGLNPILSALGQGASTPQGAQGTVNDFAPGISKGMDTAIAIKNQNKEMQFKDAGIANTNADTENKGAQRNLINSQAHQANIDAKMKAVQADLIEKTLPSMIKKAKAEGDYSEINQIMGIINSGASSAGHILDITAPLKGILKDSKSLKIPGNSTFGKPFGK